MLKTLEIDGFKSFRDFNLIMEPGLNILVGPNGSGKTNLVKFFEFLYFLCQGSLVEAISKSNGAGAVFRHSKADGFVGQIKLAFSGEGLSADRYTDDQFRVIYKYGATIEWSRESGQVQFKQQSIELRNVQKRSRAKKKWMDVEAEILSIDWHLTDAGNPVARINSMTPTFTDGIYVRAIARDATAFRELAAKQVEDSGRQTPLFATLFRYYGQGSVVNNDISGALSYNIDPSSVRQSEDIATSPGIRPNGGGLAATLYAAQRDHGDHRQPFNPFSQPITRIYPKNMLEQVSRYAQLVNSSIRSVKVNADTFENKIRVSLVLESDPDIIELPLSLASDGTVKWLALVTALLTDQRIFAIEEPENFLHPSMQREIVSIVRERIDRAEEPFFALMTTHSESLINSVMPSEIIVMSMEHGRSIAQRPANSEHVMEEINRTGFGLAHYYISGALT